MKEKLIEIFKLMILKKDVRIEHCSLHTQTLGYEIDYHIYDISITHSQDGGCITLRENKQDVYFHELDFNESKFLYDACSEKIAFLKRNAKTISEQKVNSILDKLKE